MTRSVQAATVNTIDALRESGRLKAEDENLAALVEVLAGVLDEAVAEGDPKRRYSVAQISRELRLASLDLRGARRPPRDDPWGRIEQELAKSMEP